MSRVDEVIGLARRLKQLKEYAEKIGVSVTGNLHDLDRATFDAVPGAEEHLPATDEHPAFWSKRFSDIVYFTRQPPVEVEA